MRKLLVLAITLVLFPLAGWTQTNPSRPLKVALLLPGPVTDGTFNSAADKGMKAAQQKFPNIKVTVQENITFAQSEEAMRAYARDGFDVVIGHGFQFGEPATKLYKEFPKTWFVVNTAKVATPPNVASWKWESPPPRRSKLSAGRRLVTPWTSKFAAIISVCGAMKLPPLKSHPPDGNPHED